MHNLQYVCIINFIHNTLFIQKKKQNLITARIFIYDVTLIALTQY